MSQNTLKVHDLNEDAEFDENGVEVFDEKALVDRRGTVIAGSHTACVGRDSALPW